MTMKITAVTCLLFFLSCLCCSYCGSSTGFLFDMGTFRDFRFPYKGERVFVKGYDVEYTESSSFNWSSGEYTVPKSGTYSFGVYDLDLVGSVDWYVCRCTTECLEFGERDTKRYQGWGRYSPLEWEMKKGYKVWIAGKNSAMFDTLVVGVRFYGKLVKESK